MTPSDLPEQGDPADGRQWTIHVCEDCDQLGHGPGSRCRKDRRRTWTKMASVEVVPLERARRAEEAARTFARSLAEIALDRSHEGGASDAFLAMNALELHPGFLPNDPGENG